MDIGEPLEVVEVEVPAFPEEAPSEAPSEAPERREDQPVPAPA